MPFSVILRTMHAVIFLDQYVSKQSPCHENAFLCLTVDVFALCDKTAHNEAVSEDRSSKQLLDLCKQFGMDLAAL